MSELTMAFNRLGMHADHLTDIEVRLTACERGEFTPEAAAAIKDIAETVDTAEEDDLVDIDKDGKMSAMRAHSSRRRAASIRTLAVGSFTSLTRLRRPKIAVSIAPSENSKRAFFQAKRS